MMQTERYEGKGNAAMQRKKGSHARAGRKRYVVLLLAAILLALLLIAGVMMRMLGWRGQHSQTQLTTALVNPWNSVDATGYKPNLVTVREIEVDQSCSAALEQLLADCEAAGCAPALASGYISRADLEKDPGLSLENDEAGYSEHELGLAVDFRDTGDGTLNWLKENAWHHGFIPRYPEGSEELTGMPACPAHYRYVGEAAAAQIQQLGITLEEYVTMFYNDSASIVFEK